MRGERIERLLREASACLLGGDDDRAAELLGQALELETDAKVASFVRAALELLSSAPTGFDEIEARAAASHCVDQALARALRLARDGFPSPEATARLADLTTSEIAGKLLELSPRLWELERDELDTLVACLSSILNHSEVEAIWALPDD